jgi:hypothetical protein
MTRLDTMITDGEYSRLLALMRAADVEAEDDAQVPVRDVVDPGVSAAADAIPDWSAQFSRTWPAAADPTLTRRNHVWR